MMARRFPRPRSLATLAATVTLVTAGAAALVFSQPPHAGGPPSGPSSGKVKMPAGLKTVPLSLHRTGEHLLIPVSVNGAEAIPLVFDTGMPSPGVLLYESARVDALGLEYGPERVRVGGAGGDGQSIGGRLAHGVTLKVGGAEISETVALVMPPPRPLADLHAGVIGAALYRNFVVTIDHDRGVIELTRPRDWTPPKGVRSVALELDGNFAYVAAGLVDQDGKVAPLRLLLDLGATHAVSLNPTTSKAIRLPPGSVPTRIGRGMSGTIHGHAGRIPGLEIGGYRLERVIATFPEAAHENPRGLDARNGNLGGGVLGRFNLTLDYGARKMYLVPNRRFAEPFEWDMSGLTLDPGAHGFLAVAQVLADSPAAIAGMTTGDIVIGINGEPVTNADFYSVRERLRRDGEEVELRIRRGVEERAVAFRLARRL